MTFEQLGLDFVDTFSSNANLDDRTFRRAALSGLNAIFNAVDKPMRVVPTAANVTDAGVEIAAASETGRKISIYNNGTEDVIIMQGGAPRFEGQDEATVDFGRVIEPGDVWITPLCTVTAINARCRDDKQSSVTIETYTQVS